jgi:hypothetical protein
MKRKSSYYIIFIVCAAAGFYFFNKGETLPASTAEMSFSHFVHTKQHNIKCMICHKGINTQMRAGIPNIETCSVCHADIINPNSKEEKKINEFVTSNKLIAWQNYYRVPDYVYFSHRRHVKLGNLDCKLCHGDMTEQKTKVLTNFRPVEMDGCVDCHKKSNITVECNNCHH